MRHSSPLRTAAVLLAVVTLGATPSLAAPTKITDLSLEQLLETEVTSVSKRPEPLASAASAIFVISQEDIRRSGATSIPEALRMAPGLEVAQIDANKWAITSRGFNAFSANKLLVLMDGRTLYSPLFSGTLWNVQDTMMEDIERIEVIRGPGAALWGANAVNGVINIITKPSADTQGALLTAGTGTKELGFGGGRYGGALNDHTTYRVYAKSFYRDDLERADGTRANDDWYQWRSGFRVDSKPDSPYAFTIQGDAYNGNADAATTIPIATAPYAATIDNPSNVRGANLLSRFTRTTGPDSELMVQLYYDLTKSNDRLLGDHRDIVDLEMQYRFQAADRHEITWGAGYRFLHDQIDNSTTFSFSPASRSDSLFSAFLQDEVALVDDLLKLTVGSKFEHNDYSGFEVQPNVRLAWTPDSTNTVWAAVSRAVRTPSQADQNIRIQSAAVPAALIPPLAGFAPGTVLITTNGNEAFDSEEVVAYELGYRIQATSRLAFDTALFYNDYRKLRTTPPANPAILIPATDPNYVAELRYAAGNTMDGETYGLEIVADAKPLEWWRLQIAYTFLRMTLHESGQGLYAGEAAEGESPRNQFSIRNLMDLGNTVTLDTWLRYVENLPTYGLDSYVTLDVRLGWQAQPGLELALVGKNLLNDHHTEFGQQFINIVPSEIARSVYGKATWSF